MESRSWVRLLFCLAAAFAAPLVQAQDRGALGRIQHAFSANPMLYVWTLLGALVCYLLGWFILGMLVRASEMPSDAGCAGCLGGLVAFSLFSFGLFVMIVPIANWIVWLVLLILFVVLLVTLVSKGRARLMPLLILFLLFFLAFYAFRALGPRPKGGEDSSTPVAGQSAEASSAVEPNGAPVDVSDIDGLKAAVVLTENPVAGQPGQVAVGTGFFIDQDSTFLTCNHCVEGSSTIKVVTHNKEILDAQVLATDSDYDLALCRAQGPSPHYFELAESGSAKVSEDVQTIGYALGITRATKEDQIDPTLSASATIGAVRSDLIQISGAINHGNSGGPLFEKSTGKVVGVVVAKAQGEGMEGVGFATSIDRVQTFLARYYKKK